VVEIAHRLMGVHGEGEIDFAQRDTASSCGLLPSHSTRCFIIE
jgi:hypothetical protein